MRAEKKSMEKAFDRKENTDGGRRKYILKAFWCPPAGLGYSLGPRQG